MLKKLSRVLPVRGFPPKPGDDMRRAPWLDYMRSGEIALFCFDAVTGNQLLKLNGEVPRSPTSEYCVAYPSRLYARLVARGSVAAHRHMICALYSAKGKWLETVSDAGVRERNEGLGLALLLLCFPLWVAVGAAEILLLAIYATGESPLRLLLTPRPRQEWIAIIVPGLFLGACTHGLVYIARLLIFYLRARPGIQPFGSRKREAFYRQLAAHRNLLAPKDISFEKIEIEWPDPEKHKSWVALLQQQAFQNVGQYHVRETRVGLEMWIKPEENLNVEIVDHPIKGMWIAAFTRFQDGTSFTVVNKDKTVLDPHPKRKSVYLGSQADANDVLEQARALRPAAGQITPSAKTVLVDYANSWREYIQWRRSRGTTVEEYRRIDEQLKTRRAQVQL